MPDAAARDTIFAAIDANFDRQVAFLQELLPRLTPKLAP